MLKKYLRLHSVLDLTGLSRSAVYQAIADGRFPRQYALGARSVGWDEAEISNWLAGRIHAERGGEK